jgi:hypothetical protein
VTARSWRAAPITRTYQAKADRGLDAAGRLVAQQLTQTLSVPGQGRPSPVGQPPRRQTGALQGAAGVRRTRTGVEVGIIDAGQRTKAAVLARRRPYLPPTMRRTRGRLLGEFVRAAKR